MNSSDWIQTVLLVSQIIVNIVVVGTFILYHYQLRTMRHQLRVAQDASQGQNLLTIFEYLQRPYVRDARRTLINLKDKPLEQWGAEGRAAAQVACGAYDVVANLAKREVVPLESIVDIWGYSVRQCYTAATPLIAEYRGPNGRTADYWDDLEWLSVQSSTPRTQPHHRRSIEKLPITLPRIQTD